MKQALLVVDVQESFRRRPYFREQELPGFLRNVQSLIDRCQSRGIAVVQVFHQERPDDAGNPFSAASGCVRAMRGAGAARRCRGLQAGAFGPVRVAPWTARRSRIGCASATSASC